MTSIIIKTCILLSLWVVSTNTHITITPPEVYRNAYVVTFIRVPHGCEGSPTSGITITIPEGVTNVKPQAIPGWNVNTTMRPLNPPIISHGTTINETVNTVTFNQGPPIGDTMYFDFGLMWKSPDRLSRLLFAVNQTCTDKVVSWSQIPANSTDSVPFPAAGVNVIDPPPAVTTATTGKTSAGNVNVNVIPAVLATLGAFGLTCIIIVI